jgi:hypothetical protein
VGIGVSGAIKEIGMYEVTIGQDMSCYTTIEIPENTPLTREALSEIVNEVITNGEWQGQEALFEEDWGTSCATRIVSVRDEKGNYLVEDMAIDPSHHDAGQILQNWLNGYGATFQDVIDAAAEARLIDEPVMEVHHGRLKLPDDKIVEVDFEVRKWATREEMDLAFFKALAQIATVYYAKVAEEVRHGA